MKVTEIHTCKYPGGFHRSLQGCRSFPYDDEGHDDDDEGDGDDDVDDGVDDAEDDDSDDDVDDGGDARDDGACDDDDDAGDEGWCAMSGSPLGHHIPYPWNEILVWGEAQLTPRPPRPLPECFFAFFSRKQQNHTLKSLNSYVLQRVS